MKNNADDDANSLWKRCAKIIHARVSEAAWLSAFRGAIAASLKSGALLIFVPNGLQKTLIEERYLALAQHSVESIRPGTTIRFEVNPSPTAMPETEFDLPPIDLVDKPKADKDRGLDSGFSNRLDGGFKGELEFEKDCGLDEELVDELDDKLDDELDGEADDEADSELDSRAYSELANNGNSGNVSNFDIGYNARPNESHTNRIHYYGNGSSGQDLSLKFTFEHFVTGPSNQFAKAAALAVAEEPASNYNPLFIYGDSGLGKTHLLKAIAHFTANHYPHHKVQYVASETFLNEFVQAIRNNALPNFKRRYRTNDLLLIDDIQFIDGKDGMQDEFFHTFNELHDNGKQIVLSSDRPPDAIRTLGERLRNRFKMGLLADIQRPNLETRLAILRKKADSQRIIISNEVLAYIAENITQSIRELEGALITVSAFASLSKERPSMDDVRYLLGDLINNGHKVPMSAARIIRITGDYYDLSPEAIIGKSRHQPLAHARQVAMYLTRSKTGLSYPEIGREFGNRDHSTVMHAVRKIEAQMSECQETFNDVNEIQRRINEAS